MKISERSQSLLHGARNFPVRLSMVKYPQSLENSDHRSARRRRSLSALEKEMEKREKKAKEKTKRPLASSANNGGIFGGLPNAPRLTLPRNISQNHPCVNFLPRARFSAPPRLSTACRRGKQTAK